MIPEPGSSSRWSASQASRCAASGSASTFRLQALAVQRAAQHQRVRAGRPVPSCSATSAVTRAFAVAVVASTGTPGGSSASIVRSRR